MALGNRTLPALICLSLGVFLSACLPTSENPIVKRSQSVIDDRLIGSWFGTLEDDDDFLYLHIFEADIDEEDDDAPYPEGMRMVMVSHPDRPGSDGGWAVMHGLSARNDERGVLSLWFEDDSGKQVDDELEGWHLYGYTFDNQNRMIIRGIDTDAVSELIEDGKLPGTFEKTRFFTDLRITASTDALVKLFESVEWNTLLEEEYGVFERQMPIEPAYEN